MMEADEVDGAIDVAPSGPFEDWVGARGIRFPATVVDANDPSRRMLPDPD